MKNLFRFLTGVLIFILVIILGLILLPFLFPLIIISSALYFILIAIFVFLGIIAFIWYMSREEKPKKRSKNYSIKQGKKR